MPRLKSTHIDDPAACGLRLKEAREGAGISQRRLAFPGCTAAYISRIEAGERIPSLQLLRELGRRLGVTADWLATGSDAALPESQRLLEAEVALRLDDVDRARSLYEEALAQAVLPQDRAGAIAGLGQIAFRSGDPNAAIARLEEALELYGDEATQHPGAADTLGRAYARVGEPVSAIAIFQRFLDAARGRGDQVETIRFAVLLANAHIDSGNFGAAEELIGHGLVLAEEWNDPIVRARLYWSQSRLHAEQGDAADCGALRAPRARDHRDDRAHVLHRPCPPAARARRARPGASGGGARGARAGEAADRRDRQPTGASGVRARGGARARRARAQGGGGGARDGGAPG